MYTSVTKRYLRKALKTTLIYLAAAAFCALFGGVYEIFSHGVYSGFMLYAFAFPLMLGALPFLLLSMALAGAFRKNSRKGRKGSLQSARSDMAEEEFSPLWLYPEPVARSLYHCSILTFTTGSLLNGVLEIYGTTNGLLSIYWFAGGALIVSAILIYLIRLITGDALKQHC